MTPLTKQVARLIRFYADMRKSLNPLKELPTHKLWLSHRDDDIEDFSDFINRFPYKSDPLGGLIDYTAPPDAFYDSGRKVARDCDEFARQWAYWGLWNGFDVSEVIVTDMSAPMLKSHVVTVLKYENVYRMCNYSPCDLMPTFKKAVGQIKGWKDDYYDPVYVIADSWEASSFL